MITRKFKWAPGILIFLLLILFYAVTVTQVRVTFSSSPSVATLSQPTIPPPGSLIVPDDYPTIQAAIGNASAGGTVFVRTGIYNERITIDKPLSLIGEERQNTVIGGAPILSFTTSFAIKVTSENVIISGFTIKNDSTGIWVDLKNYQLPQPSRCKIIGNNIENNLAEGISIQNGENYVISGNNIKGNGGHGISVTSSNSIISENNITENGYTTDFGGTGISAYNGKLTISNNKISNNAGGLELWNGPFDIYGNNITENREYGVQFADGCSNTPVHDNNIMHNGVGIDLKNFATETAPLGSGNMVYRNNLGDNIHQVVVNKKWAYDKGANLPSSNGTDVVSWDSDGEGNYWSDYLTKNPHAAEVDASGIGNELYVIDESNVDHYPLMNSVGISKGSPSTPFSNSMLMVIVVVVVVVILSVALLVYWIRKGAKSSPPATSLAKP